MVEATGAARLLDYGCGKGQQYEKAYVDPEGHEHASVAAYWGVREVARYVEQAGQNPSGTNAAYAMRYHAILSAPAICFVVIAVAIVAAVNSVGGALNTPLGSTAGAINP